MRSISNPKPLESIRASLQAPEVVVEALDFLNPSTSLNYRNRE